LPPIYSLSTDAKAQKIEIFSQVLDICLEQKH
jgi:hypothetical protein